MVIWNDNREFVVLGAYLKRILWVCLSLIGQNSVLYVFCNNRIWEKESGIPAFAIANTMEAVSDFRFFLWLTDKTLFPKHLSARQNFLTMRNKKTHWLENIFTCLSLYLQMIYDCCIRWQNRVAFVWMKEFLSETFGKRWIMNIMKAYSFNNSL